MQIIFTESFLYNSSFPRTKHQCIFFVLFPDPESLKMERRRYFQLDKKQLNSYTSQWVHLGDDVILPADWSWGERCWSWLQMSWFESINHFHNSRRPSQAYAAPTSIDTDQFKESLTAPIAFIDDELEDDSVLGL